MGGFFGLAACHPRFCRSGSINTNTAGSNETEWRKRHDAGTVWGCTAICIVEECSGGVSGTCTKPLSIGNIS